VISPLPKVLREVSRGRATAHATIASWNGATSTIRWVTCGDHAPLLIDADGALHVLGDVLPLLGKKGFPAAPPVNERRLVDGDRLMLLSDAVLDRPTHGGGTLGLEGVRAAVVSAPMASAAGSLRAVEDAVRAAIKDPLSDDATVVVIVPNPAITKVAPRRSTETTSG
jgi:serine phosphatase RsbU (regulator of sigma subunit)